MLKIYTGKNGSGKTLTAVGDMVKYIANGGICFSNIDLNFEAIKKFCINEYSYEITSDQLSYLHPEQIFEFHKWTTAGTKELPNLVIIDEAQIYFNSRDWHKSSRQLFSFLTLHRHYFTDIIFLTQHRKNIDSQINRLATYVNVYRDLQGFIIPLVGVKNPLPLMIETITDHDDEVLKNSIKIKPSYLYPLYNTHQTFTEFPRLEAKLNKGQKIKKKGGSMRFVLLILIVLSVFLVVKSCHKKKQKKQDSSVVVSSNKYDIRKVPFNAIYRDIDDLLIVENELGIFKEGKYSSLGKVLTVDSNYIKIKSYDGKNVLIFNFTSGGDKKDEKDVKKLLPLF